MSLLEAGEKFVFRVGTQSHIISLPAEIKQVVQEFKRRLPSAARTAVPLAPRVRE